MKAHLLLKQAPQITSLALAAFLTACGGSDESGSGEGDGAQSSVSEIEAIVLGSAPEGAITVSEARKSAKPGETVTISGKIAGTMNPFTEGYASMVLADRALQTCDLIPGDECPTPWDACCADPEHIKASRLTLQIVDPEGLPVTENFKGVIGMKELSPLVVTGVVAEGSTAENMIINLSGLYLDQP